MRSGRRGHAAQGDAVQRTPTSCRLRTTLRNDTSRAQTSTGRTFIIGPSPPPPPWSPGPARAQEWESPAVPGPPSPTTPLRPGRPTAGAMAAAVPGAAVVWAQPEWAVYAEVQVTLEQLRQVCP